MTSVQTGIIKDILIWTSPRRCKLTHPACEESYIQYEGLERTRAILIFVVCKIYYTKKIHKSTIKQKFIDQQSNKNYKDW